MISVASLKQERMIDYSFQLRLILYPFRCRETISLRGPVFHRSHGHNLVRPGHQSEVNYGYVSKICRKFTRTQSETSNNPWMTYARDSFVDSQGGLLSSRGGGPRHIGTDTLAPVLHFYPKRLTNENNRSN